MNALRNAIINELKARLPDIADRIKPFAMLLDEQTDAFVGYAPGSVFLSILPAQQAPAEFAPFELRANFGLVVTAKGASVKDTDAAGWEQATRVAQVVYGNNWKLPSTSTATITAFSKNEQRDKEGLPTGNYYWTIVFYNLCRFSAALGEQEY